MLKVIALYKFHRILPERLPILREEIFAFCRARELCGLFLLSVEGCNATMAGALSAIAELLAYLQSTPEFAGIVGKESDCNFPPFDRLKVEVREEIVTLKRPDIFPESEKNNHLSPEEWHRIVTSDEDFLVLDTRNDYEVKIGKFRGAIDPKIRQFSEFPAFVQNNNIPKDTTILMYCTGGIRCEKALLYMKQEGYRNVFQLDGGILNYLQHYPEGQYEGECFVFDHRVAVTAELKPSEQYRKCPHCGAPAKERITCARCGTEAIICSLCQASSAMTTCSKNCAKRPGV